MFVISCYLSLTIMVLQSYRWSPSSDCYSRPHFRQLVLAGLISISVMASSYNACMLMLKILSHNICTRGRLCVSQCSLHFVLQVNVNHRKSEVSCILCKRVNKWRASDMIQFLWCSVCLWVETVYTHVVLVLQLPRCVLKSFI